MRAVQKEISNSLFSQIAVVERGDAYFNSPFHFHPELELIYVKEGFGKRMIGNKLDTFKKGEVFFMGSNLPHEWRNDEEMPTGDPAAQTSSIVAYFNTAIFSQHFYDLRETNKINGLINRAGRGLKVTGETRQIIATKMEALIEKKDFERIIGLMEILHILSISNDVEYLVYEGYEANRSKQTDRLSGVFNYATANFSRDITLEEIAKVAHLTPPAFCRLFKQKTGRSFVSYLNEVRISNACRLLAETGYNISEIGFNCGYKTISNFNKFFKKSTGLSPKLYRERTVLQDPARKAS